MLESINDESLLNQVREDVEFYVTKRDITDSLTSRQMKELDLALAQADKKQVTSWSDFKKEIAGWKKK